MNKNMLIVLLLGGIGYVLYRNIIRKNENNLPISYVKPSITPIYTNIQPQISLPPPKSGYRWVKALDGKTWTQLPVGAMS
jgi:hypothetical protein